MNNQPDFTTSLLKDEELINHSLPAANAYLFVSQVHIPHGNANVAMDLNSFLVLDIVVVVR